VAIAPASIVSLRTELPMMFAALTLVAASGVALYMLNGAHSRLLLQSWQESERL
jgi:hypothetical protein